MSEVPNGYMELDGERSPRRVCDLLAGWREYVEKCRASVAAGENHGVLECVYSNEEQAIGWLYERAQKQPYEKTILEIIKLLEEP